MVRLVFRPYTQFRRSICTSESLRTSIRVSPDFVLTRHSSPSFGSQRVRSGCASSRDENETPRECGVCPWPDPSSLGSREANLYFHCAFRFSLVPMTRAHARLLGPCFKTGPESTQSYSAVDWRVRGLSEDNAASSRTGPDPAPGPDVRFAVRACDVPDANESRPRAIICTVGRTGQATAGSNAPKCARAPPRALGRRPTNHDVLQEEKCTRSESDGIGRRGRRERHPSHRAMHANFPRDASESPLSTFRVSQVYP